MAERVTFTKAQRLIERHVKMLGIELTGLSAHALGCHLAATVEAACDSPPFDCSAMDGYAIRYGAGPSSRTEVLQTFVLGGEVSAAGPRVGIDPGQAVAVSTGSPIPVGAYGVIPSEKAKSDGRTLTIHGSGFPGQNIRRAGEDFRAGRPIATAGDQLSPEPSRRLPQRACKMCQRGADQR